MNKRAIIERIHYSRWTSPIALAVGAAVNMYSAILNVSAGNGILIVVGAFSSGACFGMALAMLAMPFRRQDIDDIQRAHIQRQIQEMLDAEARKHGLVPADQDQPSGKPH